MLYAIDDGITMNIWSLSFNKGDVVLGALFVSVIAGLVYQGVHSMTLVQLNTKQIFK